MLAPLWDFAGWEGKQNPEHQRVKSHEQSQHLCGPYEVCSRHTSCFSNRIQSGTSTIPQDILDFWARTKSEVWRNSKARMERFIFKFLNWESEIWGKRLIKISGYLGHMQICLDFSMSLFVIHRHWVPPVESISVLSCDLSEWQSQRYPKGSLSRNEDAV